MTTQLDPAPEFSIANLTSVERNLLDLVPDEEQRSVLYRELLQKYDAKPAYTDLSVAENVLIYQYLLEHVFSKLPPLPEDYIRYVTSYGKPELRDNMAARLSESLGAPVHSEDVFGTAGVSSALQSITLGLQQDQGPVPAGSTVLLPAPFWQGFYWSFGQTPQLTCVPVNLTDKGAENFQLAKKDLVDAYQKGKGAGHPPKLLVLTNPQNPLGMNYDKTLLKDIYKWALTETDMHIISDEMYCHSQLELKNPLSEFVSALKLMYEHSEWKTHEERVHVVWGFAKDFGLSGFRAGFVISKSNSVHKAMTGGDKRNSLSWFTPFDSLKHFYIEPIAKNKETWDDATVLYKSHLTNSFNAVASVLQEYGGRDSRIKFVHQNDANSAQFVWLDLRKFLPSNPTPEQELKFRDEIQGKANVRLLPGTTMACAWPGYFRLCFTAYKKQTVVDAVERMCKYLHTRPSPSS